MNILHIYKDYFPVLGGIENYIRVLAEDQVARGHNATALVCAPGPGTRKETLNGVDVIKAGRLATIASMPLSVSQPLIAAGLRPDLIHVHSPYPLGEVSAWLVSQDRPLVVTHHSDVVRQQGWLRLYGPLLRRVLRRADRIIATSPRYIETSSWLDPVRKKCTVIPLGIDALRFTPPETPFDGPPTLLFVGKLRYYKGLDTLLHALAQLQDVRLEVVGDGPMRVPWETLARSLGVSDRVRFHGEVDDAALAGYYHRAHAFVLPANARSEAFGMVLLEAMASGLPCITTEVGTGTSWVVQEGVTGRVVSPGTPRLLAEAIDDLLGVPERRAHMAKTARQRVDEMFTLEIMTERVMALYRDLLGEFG